MAFRFFLYRQHLTIIPAGIVRSSGFDGFQGVWETGQGDLSDVMRSQQIVNAIGHRVFNLFLLEAVLLSEKLIHPDLK